MMNKPNTEKFPRLSRDLRAAEPGVCAQCATARNVTIWREHGDGDQPEQIFIPLCRACSDRIIAEHPRLYSEQQKDAPMPGAMPTCVGCSLRAGSNCTSPDLKSNGGPGLKMKFPRPGEAMVDGVDKFGKRFGQRVLFFLGPVTCKGRVAR